MSSGNIFTFNPLFSEGANNAIRALDSFGREQGEAAFPYKQDWSGSLRVGTDETVHDWFCRLIGLEDTADSRIQQCAIRDDFAFFGRVVWNSDGIHICALQALVTTGGSLTDFYLSGAAPNLTANYYRLDLDLTVLGPIFKEALPHIHCVPDGAPRFPFVCSDEYLPVSFLEFIYLNHFHDAWVKWARSEVSKRGGELPFDSIVAGFNSGSIIARIDDFRVPLADLKKVLFAAKRDRVPNAPKPNACIADLNYTPWMMGTTV